MVTEILEQKHGWMLSKYFLKAIQDKYHVGERSAYSMMKQADRERKIIKVTLQDGHVIYGLPEWPIPIPVKEERSTEEISRKEERFSEEIRPELFNRKEVLWMSLVDMIPDEAGGRAWREFAERYRHFRKGSPEEKRKFIESYRRFIKGSPEEKPGESQ